MTQLFPPMSPDFDPSTTVPLVIPPHDFGAWPATKHLFDEDTVWAIRTALVTGRPLLLRGEPGIGKSQIARAAAVALGVPFLAKVIDERTERDDLLCYYDAVARVAAAQVCSLAKHQTDWKDIIDENRFLRPGVLWWAFNWKSAATQASRFCRTCREPESPTDTNGVRWTHESHRLCGPVVLIDEIDKADPSVPNGLLECLGNEGFQSTHMPEAVSLPRNDEGQVIRRPLVFITTNEERELPPAFLRRCLVHSILFPKDPTPFLIQRARVFWPDGILSDGILTKIVVQLMTDREAAQKDGLAMPGAAEFLDLARALAVRCPYNELTQGECLNAIAKFALKKNLPSSA